MKALMACLILFFVACGGTSTRDVADPMDRLWFDVACPGVRVTVGTGASGGVSFLWRDGVTYVLTAAHVVTDLQGNPRPGIKVAQRQTAVPLNATVDKIFEEADLAVLKVEGRALFVDAQIVSRRELRESPIAWGAAVVTFGYPIGEEEGVLTEGRITSVDSHGMLRYSAPTFYGNSGGGIYVYVNDGWRLISIAQRIAIRPATGPYVHVGRGVLPSTLLDCLEGAGYVR